MPIIFLGNIREAYYPALVMDVRKYLLAVGFQGTTGFVQHKKARPMEFSDTQLVCSMLLLEGYLYYSNPSFCTRSGSDVNGQPRSPSLKTNTALIAYSSRLSEHSVSIRNQRLPFAILLIIRQC